MPYLSDIFQKMSSLAFITSFWLPTFFIALLLVYHPCDTGKAGIFFSELEENKAMTTLQGFCLPTGIGGPPCAFGLKNVASLDARGS